MKGQKSLWTLLGGHQERLHQAAPLNGSSTLQSQDRALCCLSLTENAICSMFSAALIASLLTSTSFSLQLADQKTLLGPKQGQLVGASLTGTLLPVQAGFYVLGMYPLDSQLHDLCDHPSFKLWFFSLCPSAFWAHPVTSYRKPPDAQSMLEGLALGWHLIP